MTEGNLPHHSFAAVIFDLDGLLVDSEPIHFQTNQIFWSRYGKRFSHENLKEFMGVRLKEEIAILRRRWHVGLAIKRLMNERDALFWDLIQTSLKLTPGAINLLSFLQKKRVPLGVGTSAEAWYVNFVMQRLSLRSYFKAIVGSSEVKNGKPHPEVYLKVAQQLKVAPSKCLVLEDALNGVLAAKAAGMHCFAVPGPYLDRSKFTMADGVFSSLPQVKSYLKLVI